ncbi:NAD-dependent epimerase/dehydratase family protein [Pedococcus sp. KACC 23699]|uniref:UDP-glucose 4-epimerase n=1 Tax=Pedococcus sp. KACC 23699 TaxID=3149228 RepID=A0AAU7JQH4_9MICO
MVTPGPMRVLLTGSAGFIGTATATALRAAGHDVVEVDAMVPQAHSRPATPPDGVHVLDVRDADDWVDLLERTDVVCHLAAMVGVGVTVADLPLYAANNDLGTAALLAAMAKVGVSRFVQASSMVVYGEGRYRCPTHGPQATAPRRVHNLDAGQFDNTCPHCGTVLDWETVTEDAALDPRSSYAASKVAQEHYATAWARQAPARAISLRYHNVYGPGMPKDTPYSGVAAIFRSAMEAGRAPVVFEDGGQMRDFVHVDDVARANLAAVEAVSGRDPGSHTAYNVCSGRPITILDVARMVTAGQQGSPAAVVSGRYRLGDVRHIVASPARATAELGFTAAIAPAEGLARFGSDPLRD